MFYYDPDTQPSPYERLLAELARVADALEAARKETREQCLAVMESQEATIQRQHQSLGRFQEDLLYKLQRPLIMEIIGIADNIRMIMAEQEGARDYDALLGAVRDLEKWVEATLSNNSVRLFRDTEADPTQLNRKRQEVAGVEQTRDPEKHNTYASERPGYVWTVPYLVINSDAQLAKAAAENTEPQMFSYVIRPEEVVRLKYSE